MTNTLTKRKIYRFTHIFSKPLSARKLSQLRKQANKQLLQLRDYSKTLDSYEMFNPLSSDDLAFTVGKPPIETSKDALFYCGNDHRAKFEITFYYE